MGCGIGTSATVTKWAPGAAEVSGTVYNGDASRGCSDMQVTLHLHDHNQAIVRDFQFGAGEVTSGQTKKFTTTMVGALMFPAPVEANVTDVTADAACADKT